MKNHAANAEVALIHMQMRPLHSCKLGYPAADLHPDTWFSVIFRATEASLRNAFLRNRLGESFQQQSIFCMAELSTKDDGEPQK